MRKLKNILFLSSILLFLAFNFQGSDPSNWHQQFLPDIGSRQISDMTFVDSLTGYMVANIASDTSYILKTTNGGNNWNIVFRNFFKTTRIQFLNRDTGFVCGSKIYQTTNGGVNWIQVNNGGISAEAMHVLSKDTIWVVLSESLTGGIFRTTNGGVNWTQQFAAGTYNPTNIYFYNKNLGFAANWQGGKLFRTTNAGENWTQVLNEGFRDMQFINETTGWKCLGENDSTMLKTTNGGLNWVVQKTPRGGSPNILSGNMKKFSIINKDTLWGCGGFIFYPNGRVTGVLYHTTNGGMNWTYQVPDSSLDMGYYFINFQNKNNGWAYNFVSGGIHTNTGGDTTFLTKVGQTIGEVPKLYKLSQNYPNPFNPTTKINYELRIANYVSLKIYDINGKEISTLVNQRQQAGSYSTEFNGSNLSSGIYFYSLQTEEFKETKKMILVK